MRVRFKVRDAISSPPLSQARPKGSEDNSTHTHSHIHSHTLMCGDCIIFYDLICSLIQIITLWGVT